MNYTTIREIQKYKISFSQNVHDYDFYDSESLVDNFLLNVENRVKRFELGDFVIKCGFSIENVQPSLFENEEPIVNSRYWSMDPNHLVTISISV